MALRRALRQFGGRSTPLVREMLQDQDVEIVHRAAIAIGHLGPLAADATDDLLAALRQDNQWLRVPASTR